MPTTCPRCGEISAETAQACRDCGRDLYRVSYPAPSGFRWDLGISRVPARTSVTVGTMLLAGAGIVAGMLLQDDGDEESPLSQDRPAATAIPHEPLPSAPPPSPEPSRTKAPPKPPPTSTPPPPTSSPEPSPTRTPEDPVTELPDTEGALEFAEEVEREWGSGDPGPGYGPGYGYGSGYDSGYDEGYGGYRQSGPWGWGGP